MELDSCVAALRGSQARALMDSSLLGTAVEFMPFSVDRCLGADLHQPNHVAVAIGDKCDTVMEPAMRGGRCGQTSIAARCLRVRFPGQEVHIASDSIAQGRNQRDDLAGDG